MNMIRHNNNDERILCFKIGGISITKDSQLELKQFGIDNTSIQTGVFHP